MVIRGVLKPSIWPAVLMVSGMACSGNEKPGMVKAPVPALMPISKWSGASGTLKPPGNRVSAGVVKLSSAAMGLTLGLMKMPWLNKRGPAHNPDV